MRFDDRVTKSGYTLLPPAKHPSGDILLAEKMVWDKDVGASMQMLWAIRRGQEDMGATFFVKVGEPMVARRNTAIKAATQFLADSIEVGRLPAG
jgi:hypothetical protein